MGEGSNFSVFLWTLVIIFPFGYSHPGGCEVVYHAHIFLMTNDAEYLIMWILAICISSLEKCLFISFAQF